MAGYDFDYFVIGAGSGGVRSARIAAQHGARVGIAEERFLGGTCVNVGCVPKKLLVYAAHFRHDFAEAEGFGWSPIQSQHDWPRLIANKDAEITRLNGIYRRLLEGAGCTLFEARAVLLDANTLEVGGRRITAERILVATGGRPTIPDEPGAQALGITSEEAFYLPRFPERVIIAGGGYIAIEFAGIFNGLGAQTTQLYRGPLFLRGFDTDIRETLAEEVRKTGIDLRMRTRIERLERTGGGIAAHLTDDTVMEVDAVMYATGRRPNTAGLGLEAAGVAVDGQGAIRVDDQYATSVPNIYAVGDVTNRVNLTPVAIAEGHALADTLFGNRPRQISYNNIPTAVFSIPPVATVGMTEDEARGQGREIAVYRSAFRPLKHTLSGSGEQTMLKMIVDRRTDRVLGCHMVGADGPEIIQGLAIALNCGATKAQFDQTIGLHPSTAEEFVTLRTPLPDPDTVQEAAA